MIPFAESSTYFKVSISLFDPLAIDLFDIDDFNGY